MVYHSVHSYFIVALFSNIYDITILKTSLQEISYSKDELPSRHDGIGFCQSDTFWNKSLTKGDLFPAVEKKPPLIDVELYCVLDTVCSAFDGNISQFDIELDLDENERIDDKNSEAYETCLSWHSWFAAIFALGFLPILKRVGLRTDMGNSFQINDCNCWKHRNLWSSKRHGNLDFKPTGLASVGFVFYNLSQLILECFSKTLFSFPLQYFGYLNTSLDRECSTDTHRNIQVLRVERHLRSLQNRERQIEAEIRDSLVNLVHKSQRRNQIRDNTRTDIHEWAQEVD